MKIKLAIILLIINIIYAQSIHWEQMTSLPKPMRGTAITCNNKIYFMEADKDTSGVYAYNSETDAWLYKGNMLTPGWNLNLAAIDTVDYAIGCDPFLDRLESYHGERNTWLQLAPMPTGRQHSNCAVVNGKIYVMGGRTDWSTLSDKNEAYDPVSNSWQTKQPLPKPTENPILAAIDNKIYALCGDTLRIYDPATDKWSTAPHAPQWVSVMFGSAVIEHYFIIPGGQNQSNKALAKVQIYDTDKREWISTTPLPIANQLGGIAVLNDEIYIIGGSDSNFEKYNQVYKGTLIRK